MKSAIALVRHLEQNLVEPPKGLLTEIDFRARNNDCRFLIIIKHRVIWK